MNKEELRNKILEIKHELLTQDNLATSLPIFIVQSKKRIYGMDTNYSDDVVWVSEDGDCVEATKEEAEILDLKYKNTYEDSIDGYLRTAYVEIWEHETSCLTRKGAEEYIRVNGHNLIQPRIYVESGYRNDEWEILREFIKNYE